MLHILFWWWLVIAVLLSGNTDIPEYRTPLNIMNKAIPDNASLFTSPVKRAITLSGTFGELRPNHFHAGLDIKSLNGKTGETIHAAAGGYVSRIKISAYGYGRALYLQHPNGHTTVYGHLDHFIPEIENYIKKEHYQRERFEMDLSLPAGTFTITPGQVIAYMGNSGSSTGPHLHFEIRNSMSEHVLNPLEYGIPVQDDLPPSIYSVKLYAQSSGTDIPLHTLKIRNEDDDEGRKYILEKDTLAISSTMAGIAVKVYDRAFSSSQRLGVYGIKLFANDNLMYHFDMKNFSFDEMRYSNAHRDYEEQVKSRQVFHRLFRLAGNKLPIYKERQDDGWISLETNEVKKIRIETFDHAGNISKLEFYLKQAAGPPPAYPIGDKFISYDQDFEYTDQDLKISIPKNRLYSDTYFNVEKISAKQYLLPVFKVSDIGVPLHRSYAISINASNIPARYKKKALIAMVQGGSVSNQGGKWNENWLGTNVNSFGNFTVMIDTVAPRIRPVLFKTDMTKATEMKFKISDNFGVGGTADEMSYNAWVDGKWILMELDSKSDVISHTFDDRIAKGKHILKIKVTDDKNNESNFNQSFIR